MTDPPSPVRGPSHEEMAWQGTTLDGEAFGHIRLETLLAVRRGEAVYRGTHIDGGTPVLVRLAVEHSGEPGFLERHATQAKKLATLAARIPHFPRVVASGVANGPSGGKTAFFVTEALEGKTLRKQLDERAQGGASLAEALVIFAPVATALAALHAEGLAHRAFSPEHVVFAEAAGRSVTKLTDVSLACDDARPTPDPQLSPIELRYGTPEHFKKSYGATGPATDVFTFALTLVELMAGERALKSDDLTDLYLETTNLQKRPSPRARGVSSSDAVEAVFTRALAVDPKNRFPEVGAFWEALTVAAENRASPVTLATKAATPMEAAEERRRARHATTLKRTAGFALIAATFLGGMAATLYVRSHRTPVTVPTLLPTPSASAPLDAIPSAPAPPATASLDASSTPTPDAGADASLDAEAATDGSTRPAEGAMIRVPAASFPMGSDRETRAERPMHKVVITKAFLIDAFEVTMRAYDGCVSAKKCTPSLVHFGAGSDPLQKGCNNAATQPLHPANCVDQLQAIAYCASVGKRLPTEAEWELAARGTDAREFPWGDAAPKSCSQGILRGLSGPCEKKLETFEIGQTPDGKSPFGLWDMSGNVWEWVADGFADYPTQESTDPFVSPATGPEAKGVLRGGSFDYAVLVAKTTSRLGLLRSAGHVSTGFRCAKDLTP